MQLIIPYWGLKGEYMCMAIWPISISTVICRSKPLDEALKAIAAVGIRYVEIFPGHTSALVEEDYRALLTELDLQIGTIHLPFAGMDITNPDHKERQRVLAALAEIIAVAPRYQVPVIILHPNSYPRVDTKKEFDQRQDIFMDSVAWLMGYARGANVRFAVENMIGPRGTRFGSVADEVIEWVKEQDSPLFGVCIDTTHGILNGEDMERAILEAGDLLIAIHASDNVPGKHLHAMLGRGDVDWPGVTSALRQVNYQGLFTMEIYETDAWEADLAIARTRAEEVILRGSSGLEESHYARISADM